MLAIYATLLALLALVGAQASVPRCAGSCLARKIQEAAQLAPQCQSTDFGCFCSTSNFVTAYDNCLVDHCANPAEVSAAQQAGADFCSSGQVPGAGVLTSSAGASPSGAVSGSSAPEANASASSAASEALSAAAQSTTQGSSATESAASAASQTASSLSSQATAAASSILGQVSSSVAGSSATLASLSSSLNSANAAATSTRSAGERLHVQGGLLAALMAAVLTL